MRIRRISKELEREYIKRKAIACTVSVLSAIAAVSTIVLAALRIPDGIELLLIYLAIVFLMISMICFVYLQRILRSRLLIVGKKCGTYIDVDENGILAEINVDGKYIKKRYDWNGILEIKRLYIDIGFSHRLLRKYQLALISDRKGDPFSYIINDNDYPSHDILVELHDEIVAQINKYWKKTI